jgi:hypothetical protein
LKEISLLGGLDFYLDKWEEEFGRREFQKYKNQMVEATWKVLSDFCVIRHHPARGVVTYKGIQKEKSPLPP